MGRNMKNKLFKVVSRVCAVVAGCFMLASFSPSLDGRAVVVEAGVFPQGLFAKTVGYLPGDMISVTNITGDRTVDILVIGALDPSEGVAIMLSPEAAAAIGIDGKANNIVKITKRSNQDGRDYGSAIIASQLYNTEDYAKDYIDSENEEEYSYDEDNSEDTSYSSSEEADYTFDESEVEADETEKMKIL